MLVGGEGQTGVTFMDQGGVSVSLLFKVSSFLCFKLLLWGPFHSHSGLNLKPAGCPGPRASAGRTVLLSTAPCRSPIHTE